MNVDTTPGDRESDVCVCAYAQAGNEFDFKHKIKESGIKTL